MIFILSNSIKKIIYIIFLIIILFLIFSNQLFSKENNFLVENLQISEEFDVNFSKNKAIENAFREAFKEILLKILLSKDFSKIKNVPLKEIKPLVENFKIKDEKFKEHKYYTKFDVSFNKKKIYNFLENKKLFISSPSKINVVYLPLLIENNNIKIFNENLFYSNWKAEKKRNYLINYTLPIEDIDELSQLLKEIEDIEKFDFSQVAKKYNSENYIFSLIYKNNGDLNIFSKIKLKNKKKNSNLLFKNINIEDKKILNSSISNLKTHYEDIWKKYNEINTSIRLNIEVTLLTNKFDKIEKFEKILNEIDLISAFSIKNFNLEKSVYEIIYNGSPDALINKFSEFQISLLYNGKKWIVQ